MITKIVNNEKHALDAEGILFTPTTYFGLIAERPTSVKNGELFVAMDEGKTYIFNEAEEEWTEYSTGGGGGGGGDTIPTVVVTVNADETGSVDGDWDEFVNALKNEDPFLVYVKRTDINGGMLMPASAVYFDYSGDYEIYISDRYGMGLDYENYGGEEYFTYHRVWSSNPETPVIYGIPNILGKQFSAIQSAAAIYASQLPVSLIDAPYTLGSKRSVGILSESTNSNVIFAGIQNGRIIQRVITPTQSGGCSEAYRIMPYENLGYVTTAPTAANNDGLKIALLDSEPTTKYDGWLYLIKEA